MINMKTVSPNEVFTANHLAIYTRCYDEYKRVFDQYYLNANVQCYVNKDNKPVYFCIDISGANFEMTLFESLSLAEFYGKLKLFIEFREYSGDAVDDMTQHLDWLIQNNIQFNTIKEDIGEMWCFLSTGDSHFGKAEVPNMYRNIYRMVDNSILTSVQNEDDYTHG